MRQSEKLSSRVLGEDIELTLRLAPGWWPWYTLDTTVHHGVLEAGAHLLDKPFTPSSLQRKVRDVLDGA